jgi:mono/diheme cytochrome c family protein
MRAKWRYVVWPGGVVGLVIAVGLGVAYSGVDVVGGRRPARGGVAWLLGTTMDHSARRHAAGIRVPPLDDPETVKTGFQHYREMCVSCHGAPGVEPAELAKGLNPSPPLLVESIGDWKPNELFWITKYGVRMTGMPAWGVTHSDDKIWALVAFMQGLPKLSAEDYQKLDRETPEGME